MTDYYEKHAEQFYADTVAVDMGPLYQHFLKHVPAGQRILDAGCGSGRDALAFQQLGYSVSAFDASSALASKANQFLKQPVEVLTFEQFAAPPSFAGIWACASLLHVPAADLPDTFSRLWAALLPGGVLYCSFKYGDAERDKDGRHFTDANEQRVQLWTRHLAGCVRQKSWVTEDQRPGRVEQWFNLLLFKAAVE